MGFVMGTSSIPNLPRRATISQVAEECGLSITTVSKVMNRPVEELDVSKETQERVRATAHRLHYRPSWRAKVFARQHTGVMGILSNRSVPAVLRGVWGVSAETLVNSFADRDREVQFLSCGSHRADRWQAMLLDGRFDGVVVLDHFDPLIAGAIRAADLPAVLLNAAPNGIHPAFIPDDREGGRKAAEALLGQGHRHVIFAGDEHNLSLHFSFADRLAGATDAMTTAGAPPPSVLQARPAETIAQILSMRPRPTAIIAYHAMTAIWLHQALWRHGVRVPDDMSLVTFDDLDICRSTTPPLTVIDVPMGKMAARAAARLLEDCERMDAGPTSPAAAEVFPETLVVRESIGPARPFPGE